MAEAWDLAPDNERMADEVTTFILFCEDAVNEPAYFRTFKKEKKVMVNTVEDQKHAHINLVNSIDYCVSEGLMDWNETHYLLKPDVTKHIWCVYDRDTETNVPAQVLPANNLHFTTAIQAAEQTGLKVAWSNDVFEMWILLHFEPMQPGVWRHREYVYERLTEIFKTLPGQSPEMQVVTGNPNFNYKAKMKHRGNFLRFVEPLLSARLHIAIQNAQNLEAAFGNGTPYHDCNPCTKIHRLVQSIISFHA
ncbi:MAG: RloB family protein [Chitinophagaceae bacterium]|nr:RloB family protein [Chitinophagaceae bacterium]